jgi:RNA polymerase sigma-70 factor (ECF subfamily)
MTRDRDVMLVNACLSGDTTAFGALVDAYESKLYNVALRITGSRDDAMDVTQNAFVKAYEKLHTFDPSYRFFSWIYRITVNEALNLCRRRRDPMALDSDPVASAPSPEQSSHQAEVSRTVHRALGELGPEQRALLVLKHLEGFSYREIAAVLGTTEKRVKSRLFTARRKLRDVLAERGSAE